MSELAIEKILPFSWKTGNDGTVVIHAMTGADITCGAPGLQLFVDTTAETSMLPANCGQLLQVSCIRSHFLLQNVKSEKAVDLEMVVL